MPIFHSLLRHRFESCTFGIKGCIQIQNRVFVINQDKNLYNLNLYVHSCNK